MEKWKEYFNIIISQKKTCTYDILTPLHLTCNDCPLQPKCGEYDNLQRKNAILEFLTPYVKHSKYW